MIEQTSAHGPTAGKNVLFLDIALIALISVLVCALAAHPYFFGDELVPPRVAIQNGHAFWPTFQALNLYKPRLVFNSLQAILASNEVPRFAHTAVLAACLVWINVLLFIAVRGFYSGGRLLAWMVVGAVVCSRFDTMFYFDYISGVIESLSTALLVSALMLAWRARQGQFTWSLAIAALFTALLCVFTHERYAVGFVALGGVFALAELKAGAGTRRMSVLCWALCLAFVPLLSFMVANSVLGGSSLLTGTAGKRVGIGFETAWVGLTYCYNLFLGGNYGVEWFWGHYNYQHPVGKIIGWVTVAWTVAMAVLMVVRRGLVWRESWLGGAVLGAIFAFVAIASLTGSDRQDARFMFPASVLLLLLMVVMLAQRWRYVFIGTILCTNVIYLSLGSYDSIAYVYSSRAANSLASALRAVAPAGRNGIVVGVDNSWIIGGGEILPLGPRRGDVFSKLNLSAGLQIDPLVDGYAVNRSTYDFGLAFAGFGAHHTAQYRVISVEKAFNVSSAADAKETETLPFATLLGDAAKWSNWQSGKPAVLTAGNFMLAPGRDAWLAVPTVSLDGHWLVYKARNVAGTKVPMRLQVNWHGKPAGAFISASIKVVYPDATWQNYAMFLDAPPGAEMGYVYMSLHDGAEGTVEIQTVGMK